MAACDASGRSRPEISGPALVEHAPAKVNLTLRVLGRRADGYHELQSLVAFAACGDYLAVRPDAPFGLAVAGPFAAMLDGPVQGNLVWRAVEAALAAAPELRTGAFELTKLLPVASGIGGGSADAAAAIRLLQRLDPVRATAIDWQTLALGLGADVPVCLGARAALMSGIGEAVKPLPPLPPVWCVLVNPRVPLATGDVFRALAAPALRTTTKVGGGSVSDAEAQRVAADVPTSGTAALLDWVAASSNDLEAPAVRLSPVIADVLQAIAREPGTRVARMSGSGATCFGLYASEDAAAAAARGISLSRPDWWVQAASLS